MITILATTSSFAVGNNELLNFAHANGLIIIPNPKGRPLRDSEFIELLNEYKPVGLLAGTETIGRPVLLSAKDYLRVISRVGAGIDNVDIKAAHDLGILVFKTAGVLRQPVAELTVGFILSALRKINNHDRQIREGLWRKNMGGLLQGKKVGIIGFGSIGQRVGELVTSFGANVIYSDPRVNDIPWARSVNLSGLLKESDIITIHADGKEKILGAEELNLIQKKGAILVNTARGGLVDEAALIECLEKGTIGYACLDVFEDEPYQGKLTMLENVILTPHIGSYALESRRLMEETAVQNLLQGMTQLGLLTSRQAE